jgi:4'-phosphopantetheinyl transferase EntD
MPPADITPSSLWRNLLPPGAAAHETACFTHSASLHPQEFPAVRNAVPKRVEEFAAGRACAHRALAALGCAPAPLPKGENRSPVWPHGITGSITHTHGHCAAAAAWRQDIMSIGIDAEIIGRVGEDMLRLICTTAERERLAALNHDQRAEAATLIFSAKEAFYKCQSSAGGELPGFQHVALHWHGGEFLIEPCGTFTPAHHGPLQGRYSLSAGKVFTAITFPAR